MCVCLSIRLPSKLKPHLQHYQYMVKCSCCMYLPFHRVLQTKLVIFSFQTVRSQSAVGLHGSMLMDCASIPFNYQRAIYWKITAILLNFHGRPAFSLVKHLSISVCVRNVRQTSILCKLCCPAYLCYTYNIFLFSVDMDVRTSFESID